MCLGAAKELRNYRRVAAFDSKYGQETTTDGVVRMSGLPVVLY